MFNRKSSAPRRVGIANATLQSENRKSQIACTPWGGVNRKLCVLMLSSSYPKFAGDVTAPFIEAIAQGTQAQGHNVTILLPYHPDLKRQPVENGVQIHTYKYVPFKKWCIWGYAASMQGDVKLRKTVYALLPLVLLTSFCKMLWLTYRQKYDVIQAHWVIPNAPIAVLVGWLRRIPVVISLHGSDVYVAERLPPVGWVARWAFKRAAAVTASSPDLLQRAQRLGAPTEPSRARFIPYGANANFAAYENIKSGVKLPPTNSPMLLCVGRLVYKKGFEYAIRAMPSILETFPATRLIMAGKGDIEGELRQIARDCGVSAAVEFVGVVPHDQIPAYLAACDIFLLPSVVDDSGNVDGLPNTLLEAMANGCAVIASRVAGVPEVVRDGQNGLLTPQRDPQAIAQAVIGLLSDPTKRERLGAAARATIIEELSWQAVVARYIEVFQSATY